MKKTFSKKYKLKKIFKQSSNLFGDLIFLLSKEGKFLDYIGEEKLLAFPPDQFLEKKVEDVFPPEISSKIVDTMKRVIKTKTFEKMDLSLNIRGILKHFDITFVLYDDQTIVVFARDKTDLRLAESETEIGRKNIQKILESIQDGLYIIDEHQNMVYCNYSIEKDFGKNTGEKCYTYLFGRYSPCELCYIPEVKKGKSVKRKFYSPISKKTYETLSTPYHTPHGEILKLSLLRDITEKEKAKNALMQSEKKFKTLSMELELILDSIPDAIYYKDKNNNFLKVNCYYAKMVGMDKDQVENKNAMDIYPKQLAQQYWEYDMEVIKNKQPLLDIEEEWDTKLGKRWVILSKIPILDDEGKVSGILGIAKDITDRKIAENKLRESEELFKRIADHSVMGIGIIQDNQVKYINKTICDIFGYSEEEMKSWTIKDIGARIYPEDRESILNQLLLKLQGAEGQKINYKYRIIRKDGSIGWVDNYSGTIMYNEKPADLVTIIDITKNMRARQELIKLNELRSELLSRSSHELKTPLSIIKGYTELLTELNSIKLDPKALEMLEMIEKGVLNLEDLIKNILNASRVKAKQLEIKKVLNNFSTLIHQSVSELEGLIKLRTHTIEVNIDEHLEFEFDWNGLFQVLRNLISNAIKFTPPHGKIEITTQRSENEIIVSVKDNGIGFEPEEKKLLFSEFGKIERYGKDLDVIPGGSGLGLYISKYIIELHGGKIWMESAGRDKGSQFYFSLPLLPT